MISTVCVRVGLGFTITQAVDMSVTWLAFSEAFPWALQWNHPRVLIAVILFSRHVEFSSKKGGIWDEARRRIQDGG